MGVAALPTIELPRADLDNRTKGRVNRTAYRGVQEAKPLRGGAGMELPIQKSSIL